MATVAVEPRTEYLLRLGDDSLVLGNAWANGAGMGRCSRSTSAWPISRSIWSAKATLLLNEAGDGDRLAFHRDVLDFKNLPCWSSSQCDFAQTIARHLLYTTWQHMLLQRLTESSDQFLREFAHKAAIEIAYHRELAGEWTVRLGDGTEESACRMAEGLDWNWRFVPELFEVDEACRELIDAAGSRRPARLRGGISVGNRCDAAEAQLEVPAEQRPILGGHEVITRASRPFAGRHAVLAPHLPRRDLVE
jgi:ring-1,2-phenylacetyl-CoA epoxidase subunit PaaC